jgi:hypothetical protein
MLDVFTKEFIDANSLINTNKTSLKIVDDKEYNRHRPRGEDKKY